MVILIEQSLMFNLCCTVLDMISMSCNLWYKVLFVYSIFVRPSVCNLCGAFVGLHFVLRHFSAAKAAQHGVQELSKLGSLKSI